MNHAKLVFIGGGNMAASLIGGLVHKGYAAERITACDPIPETRTRLSEQYGINTSADNRAAVGEAEVVVLAVKPQLINEVAGGLKGALNHRPLVISIVAGIPVAVLNGLMVSELTELPIVRCMPNTPALLQLGATGLYATKSVNAQQRQLAEEILAAVGITAWLDSERGIDAVTALSGSGPAYFFLVMEAMMAAGEKFGLAPEVARDLTLQTALGAAQMALESDVDVAELRRRVTSPGGTTEAALNNFQAQGLADIFENAMTAAFERAQAMGIEAAEAQE
ncbi:MAG: pyrroline-5-carboxylate reductase [Porticoccaceae bacterium]